MYRGSIYFSSSSQSWRLCDLHITSVEMELGWGSAPPPSKDLKLTLLPWSSCAHFSTSLLATTSVPIQCLNVRLLPLGGQASGASEDTSL